MSDLPFLSKYSGETADGLIALEKQYRTDSLVSAFEQALDQKASKLGPASLTAEEQVILAVTALEREVNNGGYSQFFFNSSNRYAPKVVAALDRIGCAGVARLTEQAIRIIAVDDLASPPQASDAAADLTDAAVETLNGLDEEYYRTAGDLSGPLFEFIKLERVKIVLG